MIDAYEDDHCPHCGAVLVWGAGPACPEGCRLDLTECAMCGEELHPTDDGCCPFCGPQQGDDYCDDCARSYGPHAGCRCEDAR